MNTVIALMDDLFFQMKVSETAKQLGIGFKVATTSDALIGLLESAAPQLVIVDLNSRSSPIETIERLRKISPATRVIAFLSHVQRELAQRAAAAGCDEVMPRSAFTQNLASILTAAQNPQSAS